MTANEIDNVSRSLKDQHPGQDHSAAVKQLQQAQDQAGAYWQKEASQINSRVNMQNLGFPQGSQLLGVDKGGNVLTETADHKHVDRWNGQNFQHIDQQDNKTTTQHIGNHDFNVSTDGTVTHKIEKGDNYWTLTRDLMRQKLGHDPTNREIANQVAEAQRLEHKHNLNHIRTGSTINMHFFMPPDAPSTAGDGKPQAGTGDVQHQQSSTADGKPQVGTGDAQHQQSSTADGKPQPGGVCDAQHPRGETGTDAKPNDDGHTAQSGNDGKPNGGTGDAQHQQSTPATGDQSKPVDDATANRLARDFASRAENGQNISEDMWKLSVSDRDRVAHIMSDMNAVDRNHDSNVRKLNLTYATEENKPDEGLNGREHVTSIDAKNNGWFSGSEHVFQLSPTAIDALHAAQREERAGMMIAGYSEGTYIPNTPNPVQEELKADNKIGAH